MAFGHGNALAQIYNHVIMPLANRRDKRTQVLWGIRDFERRFGRYPEGMWLSETAVDRETLEILADAGSGSLYWRPSGPRVRRIGSGKWKDVKGGRIDPSRAYLCKLSHGRKINLFFYDGPISNAVAFEKLLNRGEDFAERLLGGFSEERDWPQLLHIATDGETYGHHHKFGDMALAYALSYIEGNGLARITITGISGKAPACPRSANIRRYLLELLPRRRKVAKQLWMQFGRESRMEPGVESLCGRAGRARDRLASMYERREGIF
jgi:hypothetical protein